MSETVERRCPLCLTPFRLFRDKGRDVYELRCLGCGNREGIPVGVVGEQPAGKEQT